MESYLSVGTWTVFPPLSDYSHKSRREQMLTSLLFVLLLCRQTVSAASSSSSFGISAPVPLASEALSLPGDAAWTRTSARNASDRSPTNSFTGMPVKQSPPSSELCDKLHLTPRQKQMCVQGGDGLPEALLEAIRMSVFTCQQQFKHERWNCTLDSYSRIPTLKKAYKESAALYAFSAAGVAHAVARACAAGRLRKCHCAEADNEVETRQTWRWGGCGDNLAYGRSFALKFLDAGPSNNKRPNKAKADSRSDVNIDQKSKKKKPKSGIQAEMEVVSRALRRGRRQMNTPMAHVGRRKTSIESVGGGGGNLVTNGPQPINKGQAVVGKKLKNESQRQRINRHNNAVGIKVVEQLVNRTCKCHGVSGSCSVKTCWHQLAQFTNTAAVLKIKYDNAVLVNAEIQENSSHLRTVSSSSSKNQENNRILPQSRAKKATDKLGDERGGRNFMISDQVNTKELIYQQRSPDFCVANSLGPGTTDRQCLRGENCDILCCGRGYNVHRTTENVSCNCKLVLCCHVECESCWVEKTIHTCK